MVSGSVTSRLFAFQGISVNRYGQLILARIIIMLDLWLLGHFALLPGEHGTAAIRRLFLFAHLRRFGEKGTGPSAGVELGPVLGNGAKRRHEAPCTAKASTFVFVRAGQS